MTEKTISDMLNLGPKSAKMLAEVGIKTVEDLEEYGAVDAYLAIKREGIPVSLNMLYAMYGALTGVQWDKLDRADRENLIMELDDRMEEEGM
jgi:DNA transformation protein